ncbi:MULTISPECIES: hypothetical protein [Calothrix]|uniref:Uncharacterized protein n=2 Tax=Calothrix TaxID=1186 RepID=A0ABR8ANS7_9CYAN|nr:MULTISPECIES: hypothetical protein [Calothrix]MBD2200873.1 hypothetical protein [Calothrix parietina FACHB-288]MBD2229539.1 hypothetical protein [Calothrix anomala FACHB-343]
MFKLQARSHLLRAFLPTIIIASCVTMASHPVQAYCPGSGRPLEQVNSQVKQRAIQLKNDPNQFFGKKMLATIGDRRITLTAAFDRLSGLEKQQVLNTLQLNGSSYEVYTADGRLVSVQGDGCNPQYLLTERDRYRWYLKRPPISAPLPMLQDALRNAGQPIWRKVNQSIHPEDERRARLKFWETVGYDNHKQGWWIAWVPEGGYFEVTVRNADHVNQLKPYLKNSFPQYRHVVLSTDGTPLYDTQKELGNPWVYLLGNTSTPTGWSVSPCDAQNPFLCVYRNKPYVGSVTFQRSAYDSHPILQREFTKLGLVPGLITYSNPNDKAKVLTALKAVIADYYKTIESDRAIGFGKGYKVQLLPPEEVKVGGLPGLRYGFKGIDPSGQVREKSVSYLAFDGNLNFIITGYNQALDSNEFKDLANLEQFEPHLKIIVENLQLTDSDR